MLFLEPANPNRSALLLRICRGIYSELVEMVPSSCIWTAIDVRGLLPLD